jgi:CO/xanthine dehydrogenase Mo-binding subunit
MTGHPDIGGSRASTANIAAELLGIDHSRINVMIGDTNSVGFSNLTGGSRVTFASAMVVTQSAEKVIKQLCSRAAKIWKIDEEAVIWEDGHARPAGDNAGKFEPLSLAQIAAKASETGGPIGAATQLNTIGAEGGFSTHIADVEVDRATGRVWVTRMTCFQDVGRAIHPDYVEGQLQGAMAQAIGWALSEEYIYNKKGQLDNAGFLDYRMPVASDLPMLECGIIEIPNPKHPQGVKGVGEVPLVPGMAAVANAVYDALGIRFTHLPMSPPKVLDALEPEPLKMAAD